MSEYQDFARIFLAELNNPREDGRMYPSVLINASEAINGDRADDYGPVKENFDRMAAIASSGLTHKLTQPLTAMDMCWLLTYALKGSRAAHGLQTGTYHLDTWTDTAGYAALSEQLTRKD